MGAQESDNNLPARRRTHAPLRAPLVCAAIFCWLAAAIGITAAVYAYASTPDVMNVPYEIEGKITGTRGKLGYLLFPIFEILFAPLIMGYYLMTWESFKRTMGRREEDWKELVGYSHPLSMSDILLIVDVGFCLFQAISLATLLYRCSNLLGMASPGG